MGIGDYLLATVILIIIVVVVVAAVFYLTPFNEKINFDSINRNYLSYATNNGGLTYTETNNLENELLNNGYKNVVTNISQAGTLRYGEELVFEVTALYEKHNITIFNSSIEEIPFSFKRYQANRVVIN